MPLACSMPALLALKQSVAKLWNCRKEERRDLEMKIITLMDIIEEQRDKNSKAKVSCQQVNQAQSRLKIPRMLIAG